MKQASSRWLAVVMAVLVVWLGSGVSILQCMHTGKCTVAAAPCEADCMKVLTLQLPATTPQTALALDLQPLTTVVFLLPTLTRLPEICARQCLAPRSHYVWHSPPRHWLHLIRVLLI